MKKRMVILGIICTMFCASAAMAQADGNPQGGRRDPKQMTERMSEKLNFTQDQKTKLLALNEKYKADDYDRSKYREEFQALLTDAQKQQLEELKKERMKK